MKFIDYIINTLSGNINHWTRTNNLVVSELWRNLEKLDDPYTGIYKLLIVAAGESIRTIALSPIRYRRLFSINLKSIDIHNFRKAYSILLTYFTFNFYLINPHVKEKIKGQCSILINNDKLMDELLAKLENSINYSEQQIDYAIQGKICYDEFSRESHIRDKEEAFKFHAFITIIGNYFNNALSDIKV